VHCIKDSFFFFEEAASKILVSNAEQTEWKREGCQCAKENELNGTTLSEDITNIWTTFKKHMNNFRKGNCTLVISNASRQVISNASACDSMQTSL